MRAGGVDHGLVFQIAEISYVREQWAEIRAGIDDGAEIGGTETDLAEHVSGESFFGGIVELRGAGDGALGAELLAAFKSFVEKPVTALV